MTQLICLPTVCACCFVSDSEITVLAVAVVGFNLVTRDLGNLKEHLSFWEDQEW